MNIPGFMPWWLLYSVFELVQLGLTYEIIRSRLEQGKQVDLWAMMAVYVAVSLLKGAFTWWWVRNAS